MLNKLSVTIFLLGNAVHERFIPMLESVTPYAGYNDSMMIFIRDKNLLESSKISSVECNVYQSDCVPYNTRVVVPPSHEATENITPALTDSIFIVESWTVFNSETLEAAKKLRSSYPYNELKILLFNSNRKTLSTDVTDEQTALNDAVANYENEGFSVIVIQKQDICSLLFWSERKYNNMLKQNFVEKLSNAKSFFKETYDLSYEMLYTMLKYDMLHPNSLDKLTQYDRELGIKKLTRIVDNAVQMFFGSDSQFVIELDEICKKFTKEICLWDQQVIFDGLINTITEEFKCHIKASGLPPVTLNKADEISYNRFLYDTKFNVVFVKYCDQFFKENAKNLIEFHMDNLFLKLEELL